ncbi:YafY family transcriptional regulator [Paenibacillus sp. PCH8]|uniref:helix-turn-helix transcriptional regulator n=1 Tax=Paenibacillus sp. PCH8 TaxID=2066524 RepID=UPI000CF8F5AD|nr:YafY family protein [Paenibacillus sp. PCH8]PQP83192.1 YafY family transcriptional regulator [Paenibacillus sp. PCH8]
MKLERMLAIVMLLLQRSKVRGKDLAEMFEVSLRTIYRDIESINAAGIPITTSSGVGGGIRIMEQYKLNKGLFTTDDMIAMLTGLGIMQSTFSGKEVSNALVKLKSFVSEDQFHAMNMKTNQMMVDLTSWIGVNDSDAVIQSIQLALEKMYTLAFSYYNRKGNEQLQGVEPQRLVFKASHWYVQAYLPQTQNYRLFKLRKMYAVRVEDTPFTQRIAPHPFSDFTNQMRARTFPIKLLINSSALNRMLDYCTMDHITDLGDEQYQVNLPFIDDDYGFSILMSFGSSLRCVEPEHVRLELMHRMEKAIQQYTRNVP